MTSRQLHSWVIFLILCQNTLKASLSSTSMLSVFSTISPSPSTHITATTVTEELPCLRIPTTTDPNSTWPPVHGTLDFVPLHGLLNDTSYYEWSVRGKPDAIWSEHLQLRKYCAFTPVSEQLKCWECRHDCFIWFQTDARFSEYICDTNHTGTMLCDDISQCEKNEYYRNYTKPKTHIFLNY